jgi:hypothetical protein
MESRGGMILTGRKPEELGEKICPSITFCTTNLIWTDTGTNSGVHGERLATNRLNHNRAKYRP